MRTLALCVILATTPAFVPRAAGQLPDPAPLSWSIRVDGPTTGKPGRFVELACDAEGAAAIRWKIVGADSDYIRVCDEGRRCLFVSPVGGRFTLVCAASRSDGALDLVEVAIEIEGGAPEPGPAPTPRPPLPPGQFGLAQTVADLCAKLPGDKELFRKLAANYDAKASKAAAGAIRDIPGLLAETRTANAETVGGERERLIPTLFQPLADAIAKAGPKTLEDHCTAWREIAVGFARGAE